MYTVNEIYNDIESCWILPDGTIIPAPNEQYGYYLPDGYETMERAENACIKMSCGWGFTARLTTYQAQRLVEIENSIQEHLKLPEPPVYFGSIKNKINIWHNGLGWSEILKNKIMESNYVVPDEFRTNSLSLKPGGCTIVVEYKTGKKMEYTNVKNSKAYLDKVLGNPSVKTTYVKS
jgi:hypothetical protein